MSSSYRVLHVDAAASYRGGQRQLALLASEQVAAGMDVRCLVRCRQLHRELVSIGAAAEEWKGPVSPIGWSQLWSATRAGRNLLHAHDSRSHTALGVLGPRSLRHRLVVHRRIDDPPRGRLITRWKYQRGHIISVSKAVDQVMRRYGITPARRTIQYSATKIPAELPAPSARTNDDPSLRLLTVGALVPHKGHATLLDALSKMAQPARLFLLGEGPLEPVLRAKVLALGLTEQVRIEPYTDQRAHMLFQECDLYVHPSLTEGLGSAVLDAMAHGRPVVASTAGGLPELVDSATGWLVPPGDSRRLAQVLDALTTESTQSDSPWKQQRQAAYDRVESRHSPHGMLAGVRSVYDGLL